VNHLNVFVGGVPMVSIPIVTPAAKEATENMQVHMPRPHVLVAIEDKPRETGVLKV